MTNASMLGNMSPQLLKVVERAQQEPEGRFLSVLIIGPKAQLDLRVESQAAAFQAYRW